MWQKLFIVVVFVAILYNLGAGLYYMISDKGTTDRTLNALTRRIAISLALFAMVGIGIWMGWISPAVPHGEDVLGRVLQVARTSAHHAGPLRDGLLYTGPAPRHGRPLQEV